MHTMNSTNSNTKNPNKDTFDSVDKYYDRFHCDHLSKRHLKVTIVV